jgi:NPCBM/NEW2 domain-containing protein
MDNGNHDSSSPRSKGGWWSRMSQYQQIAAAIAGALVTGLFGLLIAFVGISRGSPHVGTSSATDSSPSPVLTQPITSGARTTPANAPTSPSARASASGQFLADLSPVSNYGTFDTGDAAINGRNYLNSVILDMNFGKTSAAYNLERQWRTLEATVGLRDDSTQKDEYEFQVFADGRPIYSHLFALGHSQHIRLNIAGVLRLELRATLVGDFYGDAYGVWGNADLTR